MLYIVQNIKLLLKKMLCFDFSFDFAQSTIPEKPFNSLPLLYASVKRFVL